MTVQEAINREINGLIDYLLMLSDISGNPADFIMDRGDKRYSLSIREIPVEQEQEPEPEMDEEESE